MTRPRPRTPPSTGLKIGLAALSLFLGLLVMEIALRMAGVSHPRWLEDHDILGSVHRPGVSFWQIDEGRAFVRINSGGFRDREFPIEKPPNTVRIAVLGDSYVEAAQLDRELIMTTIMEQELNRCESFGARRVEVMNFGVTGYGTAQEFLSLRHRVAPYSPDIVVLAFLTGNDIRNNSAHLHRDPGRPYFVHRNGALVFDESFRRRHGPLKNLQRKAGHVLLDVSRVSQLAYRAAAQMKKRREARKKKAALNLVQEVGLDDRIYAPPEDQAWREAWQLTEELLLMARDEAERLGARFLVVCLSNSVQVHPDAAVRLEFARRLKAENLFYPDERISSFGGAHGFSVLALAQPLQGYAEAHQVFLHGFGKGLGTGHWNAQGHRIGGKLIAQRIAGEFGEAPCPMSD
jgi:hypothetical protein